MISDIVIVIPAYNPDEKFPKFLKELTDFGYSKIIVVDDGSKNNTQVYFDIAEKEFGCKIVRHYVNLGQGRAFKSAFNYFMGNYYNDDVVGVVECDCDGQHTVEDVNKCADLLRSNSDKLILGVRDFSSKNVPFRSRFGNKCTNLVFKLFCGLDISDTQTGLKGIPKKYIPSFMETPGERFEYASSVLLDIKKIGLTIKQFPIQTIYIDGNATSHFNPLLDSIRIYSLIFKYAASSFSAAIVDLLFFYIFIILTKGMSAQYIIISTYIAKVISCTYSYLVNKNLVFNMEGERVKTIMKWITLCVVQATMSGLLTELLVKNVCGLEVVSKIVVDVFLFFISFQIQNRWVFEKTKTNH